MDESHKFIAVIEQQPLDDDRRIQRVALIAIGVFVVLLLAMAFVVRVAGAVVGPGEVDVASRVREVAHPDGGIVAQVLARDGDHVAEGTPLLRLDSTVTAAQTSFMSQSADQLLAQRARLIAEREGRTTIEFPPELRKRSDASALQAMAGEQRMMALHQTNRESLRRQIIDRVQQLEHQIVGYRSQITAVRAQQQLIDPERSGVNKLWDEGLVTITRRNQLERTAVDMDATIAALNATIAQTRARIAEAREQLVTAEQAASNDAGTQLAATIQALNEQQVRSTAASQLYAHSVVRAPVAGLVDKLAVSVGTVVTPGQKLLVLVPTADELVVNAAISPRDIDQVHVGQSARVRLPAFSITRTPEITGKVVFVSPDRVEDNRGMSFFRVRIKLEAAALAAQQLKLKAGMPAEVYIATGGRSMISYMFKPLLDQFARAFHE